MKAFFLFLLLTTSAFAQSNEEILIPCSVTLNKQTEEVILSMEETSEGKLSGTGLSSQGIEITLEFNPHAPELGRSLTVSYGNLVNTFTKSPGITKIVWNPNFLIRKALGIQEKMRVSCDPSDRV